MKVGFELISRAERDSTEVSIFSGLARGDCGAVEGHLKNIRAAVISDTAHNVKSCRRTGDNHLSTLL